MLYICRRFTTSLGWTGRRPVQWRVFLFGWRGVHGGGYSWDNRNWSTPLWISGYCKVRPAIFVNIKRHTSDWRSIYGHIDFLGKGATSLLEDVGCTCHEFYLFNWHDFLVSVKSSDRRRVARTTLFFPVRRVVRQPSSIVWYTKDVWQLHRKWFYSKSHCHVWQFHE